MKKLSPSQESAIFLDDHIALTANAGSGKTFVLAKRYVHAALKNNLSLSEIVAITFTEKAAGELYSRITREIEERFSMAKDDEEDSILRRMRRQIVSAKISTIHSFCIELLREFAPYVELDVNFAPIDPQRGAELLQQSIENEINAGIYENYEELKNLIRFFGSKNLLIQQISKLFFKRKTVENIVNGLTNKTPEEVIAGWRSLFIQKFMPVFGDKLIEVFYAAKTVNDYVLTKNSDSEFAVRIKEILDKDLELTNETLFEMLVDFQKLKADLFVKKNSKFYVRTRSYLGKKDRDSYSAEIDLLENNIDYLGFLDFDDDYCEVERNLANFIFRLIGLYSRINSRYNKLKKRNGYLDFEDILILTKNLLSIDEVQRQLAGKYKFIMVDEYQDTNDIQYDIILPLIQEFKKGKLFIVGDEKQSIYGFREADLKIFEKTKREIAEQTDNKGVMSLPHSFRLNPNLSAFVNFIFGKLFYNPDKEFNEVEANDLICAKDYESEGKVELLVNLNKEGSESELTAGKIAELIGNGRSAGEIAVLCRNRSYFTELTESFDRLGIPYTVVGSRGFYRNQIIVDFQNYLSFLINPKDDAALIALLKSPFFYFPDTLIYEISIKRGKSYYDKLKTFAKESKSVETVVDLLEEQIKLAASESIPNLLKQIIERTNIIVTISGRALGEKEVAAVEKFVDLAVGFHTDSFGSLYDFVEFVKNAVEKESDESQAELLSESEKVKVMTIHQSKGLEFPVVFIYKTNRGYNLDSVRAKSIIVDSEFGIVAKVYAADNYFSEMKSAPHINLFSYYLQRRQIAEELRLLYVAATRAEEELYLSADLSSCDINSLSNFGAIARSLNYEKGLREVSLKTSLVFMDANAGFAKSEKIIELKIPVISEIDTETLSIDSLEREDTKFKVIAGKIADKPKNEIFSATRIAVYEQCPLKYDLIYNKGLSKLFSIIGGAVAKEEFSEMEYDENIPANVKGSLIHKILELNFNPLEAVNFLDEELELLNFRREKINEAKEEIVSIIEKFRNSSQYEWLNSYGNFKNEFEIYLKRNDYYLYGIIDRLILGEERLIVVDYKTDELTKTMPEEKLNLYKTQLTFYAYLVKQRYKIPKKIETKLIFVREPEKSVSMELDGERIEAFGKELERIIASIASGNFNKNLNHCSTCQFSNKSNVCIAGGN